MRYNDLMPTPQITLRVSREERDRWKEAANAQGTNVSQVIRDYMVEWADKILES